jgi:transcriptional regulator with XRE-family HTH domain
MEPHEIKELRRTTGWSQHKMGRFFGYTSVAVHKWEHGLSTPPNVCQAVLIKLERQLDERSQQQREPFIHRLEQAYFQEGMKGFLICLFNA